MKNIFLLPTARPSELYKSINGKLGYTHRYILQNDGFNDNQDLYITSNDEIKTDEWCFEVHDGTSKAPINSVKFIDKGNVWWLRKSNMNCSSNDPECKKIILTTDTNLIKNGVQKIPHDFLEWFVNNSTCEEVEIQKNLSAFDEQGNMLDFAMEKGDYTKVIYKIILPIDESEYRWVGAFTEEDNVYTPHRYLKKDIYEGRNSLPNFKTKEECDVWCKMDISFSGSDVETTIDDEILYTEDEVKNIVEKTVDKFCPYFSENIKKKVSKEWFEQFKKEKNGTKI